MEVILPTTPTDFDFGSSSSPYATAPPTPKLMGVAGDYDYDYYFSAPTSPTQVDHLYRHFDDMFIPDDTQHSSQAMVPFAWEERPGKPKQLCQDEFAFDVSGEFGRDSVSAAEDLFHGGVIKPMKPLPDLQEMRRGNRVEGERGRELSASRSRRTRSLSPLRGSDYRWQEDSIRKTSQPPAANNKLPPTTTLTASSSKGSRKWSFKDLFLFRSASDGRAMDRDPLKKYSAILRKHDEDFRNSSMRSIEYHHGSDGGSRRRGRVSAHELHYTVNRAVSNDMKKKTFLPYKQGILGRLAFNPTVHALANGFGFSHRN